MKNLFKVIRVNRWHVAGSGRGLFLFVAFALVLGLVLSAKPAQAQDANRLEFEVAVLPELLQFELLLSKPSFLVIAMQSAGVPASSASRVITHTAQRFEFRNVQLRFVEKKDSIYRYAVAASLPGVLANAPRLEIPLTVDLSQAKGGKVLVSLSGPIQKVISSELADKIRFKAQYAANQQVQAQLLSYLQGLAKAKGANLQPDLFLESIALDANNLSTRGSATACREPGDAEPLAEQVNLILTLLIWFVLLPLFLVGYRLIATRRKRQELVRHKGKTKPLSEITL